MVLIFSLNINAQKRERPQSKEKCISTKVVEKRDNVFVTKINKCTNTKTTKTYSSKEWEKMLKERKARREEMAKKRKSKR